MPTERMQERIRRQPDGKARQTKAGKKRKHRGAYARGWSGPAKGVMASRVLPFTKESEAPRDLLARAAQEKYPWIARFLREGCPRGRLLEYAKAYGESQGFPESDVPPYTTLSTWVKVYRESGILGLIDKPNRFAGVSRVLTGEFLTEFTLHATLGKGATDILHVLAKKFVRRRLPKRAVIARALRRFEAENPHLVAIARHGPMWFLHVCQGARPHPPVAGGYRLALDSTVADIWVRIPDPDQGWVAVRVVLTIVEDIGSRLLVSFNLSLKAIDSGICLAVLGRAIGDGRNYPGLPTVGVPHEIAVDKGAEHLGAFQDALKNLRIAVTRRMPNAPRGGAHVERLIETVQTSVLRNLPGYSKTEKVFDPYAASERDAKRSLVALKYEPFRREVPLEALPTLPQLEQRILAWALVYNARSHPGLKVESPELQALLQLVHPQRRGAQSGHAA